jgi:hypothetical protein
VIGDKHIASKSEALDYDIRIQKPSTDKYFNSVFKQNYMVSNQAIKTEDLKLYSDWLAEDVLASWTICAEYLLNKYKCNSIIIEHKKLSDGSDEAISVDVSTRGLETEKVAHSKQEKDIVEEAAIAMGLLVTQLLRPCIFIHVLKQGAGYDYYYLSADSPDEELLEVTGTEIPNSGQERLRR